MTDQAASVLARLKNVSSVSGRSYQTCLQLFCQEEFLRRLELSDYANYFVLKGGLLIYCLSDFSARPSIDIDFLVQNIDNSIEHLEIVLTRIIETSTGCDFVEYKLKKIDRSLIGKKVPGFSAALVARIKNTQIPIKIDFGFGDVIYPELLVRKIPTQLDEFKPPLIQTYSMETIIAEKLDAILNLAEYSSRMKDYFDIYFLSKMFGFEGDRLRKGLILTFENRDRTYQKENLITIIDFGENADMQRKWVNFIKKTNLASVDFGTILADISEFIKPVWDSIFQNSEFECSWNPQTTKWE